MDDEKPQLKKQCWFTVENRSSCPILVRKYKKIDLFSEQRVFHPGETGIMTNGADWDKSFRAKIFAIKPKFKKRKILKVNVCKIFKIVVYPDRCSCHTIKPENVDLQLCAFHRMEEIWEKTNYYETLHIKETATQREIRVAYLKLAKKYHPDHNPDPNARFMFERIVEAYNTLSDEEIRKQYDAHLRTEPGVFSKSYWRQMFCVWNKHKAIQVGLSTFLTLAGIGVLFTSFLALPTGVGIPASIVATGVGSALFASGIGGLSIGFSSTSALEQNTNYKRWLKYSFWYGFAGFLAGSLSVGIGGLMHPILGGFAGFVATASLKGATTGICFTTAKGIASEKWKQLITRLRIDAIALDLAIGTLSGAALGILFEGALISNKVASSMIATPAKLTTKTIRNNIVATNAFISTKTRKINDTNTPLLLSASASEEDTKTDKIEEQKTIDQPIFQSFSNDDNSSNIYNTISADHIFHQFDDFSCNETVSCNIFDDTNNFDFIDKTNNNESNQDTENILNDNLDIFNDTLNENPTVDDINEAILLFEMLTAQPSIHHSITYHNLSSLHKVKMFIDYTIMDENNELVLKQENPPINEPFYIPLNATNIQIYFESSSRFSRKWEPVCSDIGTPHVFYFETPSTRRFFASVCCSNVRISQIRNEYEQCIRITT